MHSYLVDMILCGVVYLILVYFMLTLIRKGKNGSDGDDSGDGGIPANTPPELDLPPGICLPDGRRPRSGPRKKEEVTEECMA
jgi:hypothetical protein